MKNKNRQQYSNECGICAVNNLLSFYNKKIKVDVNVTKNGSSLVEMIECLKEYFFTVEAISFEAEELYKIKKIEPFIALLGNDEFSHYVVVYKRVNNNLYILDSMHKKSYKMRIDNFKKIFLKKSIICEDFKQYGKSFNFTIFFLPFLSLIETMFLLSLTIILQQIIDNGFQDAFLYVIVELSILFITAFKLKIYLKNYRLFDQRIVMNTLNCIYNLKEEFVNTHYINEIYFHLYDAYSIKNIYLSIIFDVINDVIMLILSLLIIFKYSYILGIIILALCLPLLLFLIIMNKKIFVLLEEKRRAELEFNAYYKDSFNNQDDIYINENKEYEIKARRLLRSYQSKSYKYERVDNYKNLVLLTFQTIIVSGIIIVYFSFLSENVSIGKLVAILNLSILVLQPILNIISKITNFSNFKLLKERINKIRTNIK